MDSLRLLLVEDNDRELATFRDTTERYSDQKARKVELVECRDIEEADARIDNSFDGAIIDLKLGAKGGEGNRVAKKINRDRFPIPIAILTGTPDSVDQSIPYVGVFTKGEADAGFDSLLDLFWDIQRTGITRILGGRGTIHFMLGSVLWNNLMPQIESWTAYASGNANGVEKALLRHTLNHLIQLIDQDIGRCFPEEFYLYPPPTECLQTGSIVIRKNTGNHFAVVSPSCDLVTREHGRRSTDMILVIEAVNPSAVLPWFNSVNLGELSNNKRGQLKKAMQNNSSDYYHCLPKTEFFDLSFLNFRRLSSFSESEFDQRFELPPYAQMSPPFVKDLVSRFSSYYARQGQPDIDFDHLLISKQ